MAHRTTMKQPDHIHLEAAPDIARSHPGEVAARVQSLAAHAPQPVRWFVFDLVSVFDSDDTAGRVLAATIRQLQKDGIVVVFTGTDDGRDDLDRVTIIHDVRADRAFESVVLAIDAFHEEIGHRGRSR